MSHLTLPPTQPLGWTRLTPTPIAPPQRAHSHDPRAGLLDAHLTAMLGAWPPRRPLDIRVWPGRDVAGWDHKTSPGLGVESPVGTLLSIAPSVASRAPLALDRIGRALHAPDAEVAVPAAFGRPDLSFGRAVLRWADHLPALPDIGTWLEADDPRLPVWARPFNGGVLAALDDTGRVMAAVGIKRHNHYGQEIAVETEPAFRGRRLARMLVTQAARAIQRAGALPLYLHEPTNLASAHVADASGFPDRGWRMIGLYPSLPSSDI